MPARAKTAPRPVRLLVVALLTASLLAPTPGLVRADSPPADTGGADELATLVARLGPFGEAPAPVPDGPALRRAVTPYAVRLTVDPRAVHPLAGRLAVRDTHLGAPGQALRRVALARPAPAQAQAPASAQAQAPTPAPTKPAPTVAPAPHPGPAATLAVVGRSAPAPVKIVSPPTAPTRPASAPAPRAERRLADGSGLGRSVLVTGDSLSIYLAQALRPLLAGRPGTSYAAQGKVSSGLARPDFFDWERTMRRLSQQHRPDTVLVMIATNDNQTLTRPDGSKVAFGRPGWNAEYARRVRRLVELARTGNPQARVYWVGAPVMANPRLNADVAAINAVIRRQIQTLPGCRFVDVWPTLADAAGHYTSSKLAPGGRRTTRTPDGVHLTSYGARLLADACLASLSPAVAQLGRP